jgi:hypothetical protein
MANRSRGSTAEEREGSSRATFSSHAIGALLQTTNGRTSRVDSEERTRGNSRHGCVRHHTDRHGSPW